MTEEYTIEKHLVFTNQIIKLFNYRDIDLIEDQNEKKIFSYKDHGGKEFAELKGINNLTDIPKFNFTISPKKVQEIFISWFHNNEIVRESEYGDGIFMGYIVPEMMSRQSSTSEKISVVLESEAENSPLKLELNDFFTHHARHLQGLVNAFIESNKTIVMSELYNLNSLFDWLLLYSSSFRENENVFNIVYENTVFTEMCTQDFDQLVKFLNRMPLGRNQHSIVTSMMSYEKKALYFVDKFGLLNFWKIILDKDMAQTNLQLFFNLGRICNGNNFSKFVPDNDNVHKNEIIDLINNFRTDTGKNIMHIFMACCGPTTIGYLLSHMTNTSLISIKIFFDNFSFLLNQKDNNGTYPISYVSAEMYSSLLDKNIISIHNLHQISQYNLPFLMNSKKVMDLLDYSIENTNIIGNAIIYRKAVSQQNNYNDMIILKSYMKSMTNEQFYEAFNTKIKLYSYDNEYPFFVVLWLFELLEPKIIAEKYPFMLGYKISTQKHGYKLTDVKYDVEILKEIFNLHKHSKMHMKYILMYLESVKKSYSFDPNFYSYLGSILSHIISENDMTDLINEFIDTFSYYYMEVILESGEEFNEFYNILKQYDNIIEKITRDILNKLAESNDKKILSNISKKIKDLYFSNKQTVSNIIKQNNNWFIWNSLFESNYKDKNLTEITVDIISSDNQKAHELINSEEQILPLIHISENISNGKSNYFLEDFCKNGNQFIKYAIQSYDVNTIKALVDLSDFGWHDLYEGFINIFKSLNDQNVMRNQTDKYTKFLDWMFIKLQQNDFHEKFIKYNNCCLTARYFVGTIFLRYIISLFSAKIITYELYSKNNEYHQFLRLFYFLKNDHAIYNLNSYMDLLNDQELSKLLQLDKFNNFNESCILLDFAGDINKNKRVYTNFQKFWNGKRIKYVENLKNIYDHDLLIQIINNLITIKFFENNEIIPLMEFTNDNTILENVLEKYKVTNILDDFKFDNKLYQILFKNLDNFITFVKYLCNCNDDELNILVINAECNDYNLIKSICETCEEKEYYSEYMLQLLVRCKSPEYLNEHTISLNCKKNNKYFELLNEYIKMCILTKTKIKCQNEIIKTFPSLILLFNDFNERIKNLDILIITEIVKETIDNKPMITKEQQDFTLNYVGNISFENLAIVLENIIQISSYIIYNIDLVIKAIRQNKNILQQLIKCDGCPEKIIKLENSNGDFELMTIPISKINFKTAEQFVNNLTSEDLISLNKRGNLKIIHFLHDPYIRYLVKRQDINKLFENNKIGPVIFDEMVKSVISKQFYEIINELSCYLLGDEHTYFGTAGVNSKDDVTINCYGTRGNNFLMELLELSLSHDTHENLVSDLFEYLKDKVENFFCKKILEHKNYDGNSILFLSVKHDKIFRKMFKLYFEHLGINSLMESNNSNETLLMFVIKYNPSLVYGLLSNDNIKENNNYVYANSGSVLTHTILYCEEVDVFSNLINWKNMTPDVYDVTDKVKIYDWDTKKYTNVNLSAEMMACIFNKEMFKLILNQDKNNIGDNIAQIGNNQYDIFEISYLYEPESFQYLLGSKHTYDNFPNQKHKQFFLEYSELQPASWHILVSSNFYKPDLYKQNELNTLKSWTLNPNNIKTSEIARYIQTKNEPYTTQQDMCQICLLFKKKIMYECHEHLSCVMCCYRSENCPICHNEGYERIKVFN